MATQATPWSFCHITDIHLGSPRSFRYNPAYWENWRTAREQMAEIEPDLLLVGGDLTRDGTLHDYEFLAVKDELETLPFPFHAVPGNMDTGDKHAPTQGAFDNRNDLDLNVTSEQLRRFAWYFGPNHWTFLHKGVRFTGFFAAMAGSGLPEEDEFWHFLERLPALSKARHHVVMTHYPLFIDHPDEETFDLTDPDHYLDWYFGINRPQRLRILESLKASNVDVALSGHIHCRRAPQVFDGITFYKVPATANPQWGDRWSDGDTTRGFMRFDVSEDGIEGTFVPLVRNSTLEGYGPGGHPLPELRDYSIAQERSV